MLYCPVFGWSNHLNTRFLSDFQIPVRYWMLQRWKVRFWTFLQKKSRLFVWFWDTIQWMNIFWPFENRACLILKCLLYSVIIWIPNNFVEYFNVINLFHTIAIWIPDTKKCIFHKPGFWASDIQIVTVFTWSRCPNCYPQEWGRGGQESPANDWWTVRWGPCTWPGSSRDWRPWRRCPCCTSCPLTRAQTCPGQTCRSPSQYPEKQTLVTS